MSDTTTATTTDRYELDTLVRALTSGDVINVTAGAKSQSKDTTDGLTVTETGDLYDDGTHRVALDGPRGGSYYLRDAGDGWVLSAVNGSTYALIDITLVDVSDDTRAIADDTLAADDVLTEYGRRRVVFHNNTDLNPDLDAYNYRVTADDDTFHVEPVAADVTGDLHVEEAVEGNVGNTRVWFHAFESDYGAWVKDDAKDVLKSTDRSRTHYEYDPDTQRWQFDRTATGEVLETLAAAGYTITVPNDLAHSRNPSYTAMNIPGLDETGRPVDGVDFRD